MTEKPSEAQQASGLLIKPVTHAFRVVRVPFLISFATFFVLAFPGQSHEVYRIMAENIADVWNTKGPVAFLLSKTGAQVFITLGALTLMSFVLWYVSRHLTDRLAPPADRKTLAAKLLLRWTPRLNGILPPLGAALGQIYASPVKGWSANYVLFREHFFPPEAAQSTEKFQAAGLSTEQLISAAGQRQREITDNFFQAQIDATGRVLIWGALICLIIAGGLWFFTWLRTRKLGLDHVADTKWLFHWATRGSSVLLIAAFVLVIFFLPVVLPQYLGSVAIFCLFISCVAFAVVPLIYFSTRTGFPFLMSIVALAFVWAVFDLNDNHVVRDFRGIPQDQDETKAALIRNIKAPLVGSQFVEWFGNRKDRDAYKSAEGEKDRDYPVYIVAAQGGGLYAAYHAAMFMARMQDLCPNFAQHVFAVSGVSGGSLGAAVFSGLAKDHAGNIPAQKCRDFKTLDAMDFALDKGGRDFQNVVRRFADAPAIRLEHLTDQILDADFLSPLIYSTLFPDLVQRIIPWPFSRLDRASALERSFETAWTGAIGTDPYSKIYKDKGLNGSAANPMTADFGALWTPASPQPALVLNTTEAESGFQWIISPFDMDALSFRNFPLWDSVTAESDAGKTAIKPRVSHAVSLSARFPWVTPPGSIRIRFRDKTQKVSLVDGGYFENSGVATALELITKISAMNKVLQDRYGQRAKIVLIVLTTGELNEKARGEQSTFGETLSPIRALMNTRTNRAYITIEQAERTLNSRNISAETEKVKLLNVRKVRFSKQYYDIPLGWYLSSSSRETIRSQLGDYRRCNDPDPNFENADSLPDGKIASLNADCVQRGIMHELNREVTGTLASLSGARAREIVASREEQRKVLSTRTLEKDAGGIDRRVFFSCVRKQFHTRGLTELQVATYNAILDYWEENPTLYKDLRWLAYMLGTALHESGNRMEPVREALGSSDEETIARLERSGGIYEKLRESDRAFWRRQPEHGNQAYFGRGLIQTTHARNYKSMGEVAGYGDDLYLDPNLMLKPEIAAKTLMIAMTRGLFRKDKQGPHDLARYFNDDTRGQSRPWIQARNIVNGGLFHADQIASKSKKYYQCLPRVSETWALDRPPAGYCYQSAKREKGKVSYSVLCLPTADVCEKSRRSESTSQQVTPCQFVDLTEAAWAPKREGKNNSWYEEDRGRAFPAPFPQFAAAKKAPPGGIDFSPLKKN